MADIEQMRRLAKEAMHPATKGRWMRLFGERTVYDRMEDGCRGVPIVSTDKHPPSLFEAACLDFIAAANPATIEELLDRVEAAEKERDALRSLVVMRFDHDRPPQFTQGYDPHELTEPVTAEHCRWFVAEIESLRAKIAEMERQKPVAWGAFYLGGKLNGKLYSQCDTEEQINMYIADRHQSDDSNTFRKAPLYTLPGAKGEEK